MSPTLLTFFVYLSAVEGVRSSFQSQFVRCCQCMVAAKKLFVLLWVVVLGKGVVLSGNILKPGCGGGERMFNYQVKEN